MPGLLRSLTFVPANNERFLAKAQNLDSDIVCLDLEDSVPEDQKPAARKMASSALSFAHKGDAFVRTNSPASGLLPDDLSGTVGPGLAGIVIPKVESARQVRDAEALLASLEGERQAGLLQIIPSIESPLGVVNCYEIASSSRRIPAVVFGVFDLLHEMQIEYEPDAPGAAYARRKVPHDARAAGVAAIDAIWQDTRDDAGLKRDCISGKKLGYAGKSVIHPGQLETVHEAFAPAASELSWARQVRAAYEESLAAGRGATAVSGKMIDKVHYARACALLGLAEGAGPAP